MSNNCFKSVFVIIITIFYCIYFNLLIIPYMQDYSKGIIKNTEYIHETNPVNFYPEGVNHVEAGTKSRDETVIDAQAIQGAKPKKLLDISPPAPKTVSMQEAPNDLCKPHAEGFSLTASPETEASKAKVVESQLSGTPESDTPVLLSRDKTLKVLTSLNLKDTLWLIKILSRCSNDERYRIMTILKGGITYRDNLEMYSILRQKIADKEQERLDALIEKYTK